jgi:endonuclease/exonuclease/phosphatase family metal-dependent hydrolase
MWNLKSQISNLKFQTSNLRVRVPKAKDGTERKSAPPVGFCLLLTAFGLLTAFFLLPTAFANGGEGNLLEVGGGGRSAQPTAPRELKVVSYNMRWRGGEDLRELIELLRSDAEIGGASIIGLQEVDRKKKRTAHTNTARVIAEALGMNYAWAAPPSKKGEEEEETGVAILSPYALSDVERLVLPHEGPGKRRRTAIGATVNIGGMSVRFYSVHAETRMPLAKKVEHWNAVLEDLKRHPKVAHAVVLGDFNTIKGKDVRAARKLFTEAGFATPFPDDLKTWRTFVFEMKLDWLWLRGLEAGEFGIDKKIGLSDHWPLWVKIKLGEKAAEPFAATPNAPQRPR